ncbi:MAG: molybdopterin molybdotransferase MoeA [Pirellulaceae bacterium]
MIEIDDALQRVARAARVLETETRPLAAMAGHVLAHDVQSDVDSPPFDKSMMDGFAIRTGDFGDGQREFQIVARITAGDSFDGTVQPGQTVQIMTGAPVPQGVDAVVMVEETRETHESGSPSVMIEAANVRPGQNILNRATAMSVGETIMPAGRQIRSEDIGVLAEAGAANCQVARRPDLAVLATGDELVDATTRPAASQIRNSNSPMLASMARGHCNAVTDLGIGVDDHDKLRELIQQGLTNDVLVLSGGVSAGTRDLVPGVLQELGVQQVFHKVRIKPGKPIWFGTREQAGKVDAWVFGLPGNPVSSMVCFHVFVVPLLLRLAGIDPESIGEQAQLARNHVQRPGRTTYWPSLITKTVDGVMVEPLDWKGSADLKTLARANCFAVFDGQRDTFQAGETVPVFPMGQT